MTSAYDADVLIYAASSHPLGVPVRAALRSERGIGSVLLLPELLSKPSRLGLADELASLQRLLRRLDLRPVDTETAALAAGLGATYGLRAADATHLATAVLGGADRFVTNNRRDFSRARISEITVVHPTA